MKNYLFTLAIIISVILALSFPQYFIQIGGFSLKKLIIPLLQILMFGMGATMSWNDFAEVLKRPKAVAIGLLCQFAIMPLVGFSLAKTTDLPPEIAAGVILIGCAPSGLASNVMAFIAKANVALSITITSCATLLAPILTPTLMKLLAGQFIEINAWSMMLDILNMIIFPIIAGLIFNHFFNKYIHLLDKILPTLSMGSIVLIVTIITAAGRDSLLSIGGWLVAIVLIHNILGYTLGYWGARFFGMKEQDCRTVAIEVGLQNAGLASGLAIQMGKVATVGLASGLFGPIMNTTGSILASWWAKKEV